MHKTKPTRLIVALLVFALLLSGIFSAAAAEDSGSETAGEFSCYTYDETGNAVNAYWSETDGIWYMFVPSTVSVPELTLSYTGSIVDVSAGTLNTQEGVLTDAFSASGDLVTLTTADGTEYAVQVMQSNLPSVHIVLNGTTLDEIHMDKDKKYKNNSVYIMDPDGTYDLAVEDSVEMKGRGNTTWKMFDKKGYQIKFDSKTSVLGMGKAKKWVLLANAGDDSMMRTMLTYRMAENLGMDYVTDFEYVDLWVSGEYLGTYILGEKVEPGSSRLDLENDLGVLFEQDEAYYAEEDYWFFSEMLQRHFVMKEIVEEEDAYIEAAMADFEESVDEFAEYLYFTPSEEATLEELSAMIDVDSFIKYYLVAEYVLNREAIGSSFYWYKDGPDDVIHLGPLWDYDTCMGNDGPTYTESYAHNHLMFRYLLAIPEYYERTIELWELYKPYMDSMDEDADVLRALIEDSADMNYLRWDVLGNPTNKDGSCFADTFDEAVDTVKTWLSGRETAFTVVTEEIVYTAISDDGKKMELYCDDNGEKDDVVFAVWGVADGQNDLQWYRAERDSDGIWHVTVNLAAHGEAGVYMISAYSGDEGFGKGQSYISEWQSQVDVQVSEDNTSMLITYEDDQSHQHVHFAVWSVDGGQDDLEWYAGTKNSSGQWEYTVDLRSHNSSGIFNIHVYSISDGVYTKQTVKTVTVEEVIELPLTAVVSEDNTTLNLTYADGEEHRHIHFAVWSSVGGQDDLEWYAGSKNASGQWEYTVDLQTHNSSGKFNIHVYSISGGVYTKQLEYTITVEETIELPLTAVVSEDNTTLNLTYADGEEHRHIHFAVWSKVGGQDDLEWYAGSKNASGQWEYTVDLRTHNSSGKFNIHVYSISGGVYTKQLEHTITVEEAVVLPLTAVVSEDNTTLNLTYADGKAHRHIHFAVWSKVGGQDDLEWYAGSENASGQWGYTVDLRTHNSSGKFNIHVYSISGGVYTKQLEHTITVEEAVVLPLTAVVSEDNTTLNLTYADGEEYRHVHFAVWSKAGGQDDLEWYAGIQNASGQWEYTVDLRSHNSSGKFNIHVYSITGTVYTKLIEYSVNVEEIAN